MTAKKSNRSAARAEIERHILQTAESVFAEHGFRGATTGMIAKLAGIPKANLHYYFPTKEELYRRVVEKIFTIWLQAAETFDACDDPEAALTGYINAKMDISREHPEGSKVWANEILNRAPVIQDYLETTLVEWTESRIAALNRWIAEGRMAPIDPRTLLYTIWATTQHYADFNHQIDTLNGGKPLSDEQFELAKQNVVGLILAGVGIKPAGINVSEITGTQTTGLEREEPVAINSIATSSGSD